MEVRVANQPLRLTMPFSVMRRQAPLTYRKLLYSTSSIPQKIDYLSKYPALKKSDLLPDGTPDYVKLILTSRVYDVITESPLTPAPLLSQKTNSTVFLKREDLLPVFSFKLRGAYNMISNLSPELQAKGVIACSAGNHAQGVAYSAKKLGVNATIVMPVGSSAIKFQSVSRMGAKVLFYGDDFDAARAESERIAAECGYTNVSAYDHPLIIAGQGSVALELLRQVKANKLTAIFVAIGGGGLISGIVSYIKRLIPHVKVIGVETYDAASMYASLRKGERVNLDSVGLFADGTAIRLVGEETFRICKEFGLDEIIRVSTDEIAAAIKDVFEDTRSVVEPSGALSVAGLKRYVLNHPEIDHSANTYVPVLSGANMNFDRLRFVSERAVLGEGKEVLLAVKIANVPGAFRRLQKIVHPRAVTEFSYRTNNPDSTTDAEYSEVYTSFSVIDREKELKEVMSAMREEGFHPYDLTDNEIAKSHGRYLVGGRNKTPERFIHFEFPERPGALDKFLDLLKAEWNLTLFHYRNQGDDIGKVLTGIQVPPHEDERFQRFLKELGYKYTDETDNVIFDIFLKE